MEIIAIVLVALVAIEHLIILVVEMFFWTKANLAFGFQIQCFFLLCVILASIYGAFSVKRSIFLVQGVPAILALLALIIT